MKSKLILTLFSLLFQLTGLGLLWYETNWKIVLAIIIFMTGYGVQILTQQFKINK